MGHGVAQGSVWPQADPPLARGPPLEVENDASLCLGTGSVLDLHSDLHVYPLTTLPRDQWRYNPILQMTDWGTGRFNNFWEGQSQGSNPRHGLQHTTGLVTGRLSSCRGTWTLAHGWHGGCLCFSVRPQRAGP